MARVLHRATSMINPESFQDAERRRATSNVPLGEATPPPRRPQLLPFLSRARLGVSLCISNPGSTYR